MNPDAAGPDVVLPAHGATRRPAILRSVAASVALAAVVSWIHAASHEGEVLLSLADASLLVPIAVRQAHPETFAADHWIATAAPVFSRWYSSILATLLEVADDPVVALRWISFGCLAVLLSGTWRLAARFGGESAGALAAGIVAILPQTQHWVFPPGLGLPRDVVFVALPWLALGALSPRPPGALRTAMQFLALGLITNLHPLTGMHLFCLVAGARFVVDPWFRSPVRLALAAAAFFAGAAPYVVQYVALPASKGSVDPVVYAWDLRGISGEWPLEWAIRMDGPVWICAAAAVVGAAARRRGTPLPRGVVVLAVASLAVGATWGLLAHVAPPLRSLQFARVSRFAALIGTVCLALGIVSAVRARRWIAATTAAAVLAIGIAGPQIVESVFGGQSRALLAHGARAIERRLGIPFSRPEPPDLPHRTTPGDPADPGLRTSFLAVCDFCRRSTEAGDLFLVPPENWAAFRAYAWRSVVVTRKEAGPALTFLGARGMDWYADYREVLALYAEGEPAAWDALAARRGVSYAVVDPGTHAPPWPEAFAAGPYRVLRAPVR